MPESEIHIIDAIRKIDARPEDTSYNFRTEEKDIQNRINTLFGKDPFDEIKPKKDAKTPSSRAAGEEDPDAAYETVNEGMTTDTTEATD